MICARVFAGAALEVIAETGAGRAAGAETGIGGRTASRGSELSREKAVAAVLGEAVTDATPAAAVAVKAAAAELGAEAAAVAGTAHDP